MQSYNKNLQYANKTLHFYIYNCLFVKNNNYYELSIRHFADLKKK